MSQHCVLLGLFFLFFKGVFGVVADEVKSVSVTEGDSVTLHVDPTDIQDDVQLQWKFMYNNADTCLAEMHTRYGSSSVFDNVGDGRFRDRLKLNSQSGFLTITNITNTDSRVFNLEIISGRGTSYKRFNVTVYARLSVPVIIRNSSQCSSSSERSSVSKCVLLCSVMNVTHVSLSWYKGNSLLSSISVSDLNIRLSLPLEVEYHDTNTYRCVVSNPITNHTQHLHINDVCQTCSDPSQHYLIPLITILVVVLLLVIVFAIYCHYSNCIPQIMRFRQRYTGPSQTVYNTSHMTTDIEAHQTAYSRVGT